MATSGRVRSAHWGESEQYQVRIMQKRRGEARGNDR